MKSNSPERDTGGGDMEKQANLYCCKFCDLDYVFRNDCKLHVLNIHGQNTYDCDACPRLFYDEQELSEHTKTVHRGLKRNYCTLCSRSYKTARQLTVHMDYKHKIEKSAACEKCGQEFHNNVAYRKHLQLHHKPHHIYEKCSECDRSFRFSHHLNLHKEFDHRKGGKKRLLEYMKNLNVDKSLTTDANRCKSCNIKFKCSIDLIQHLKINHARKVRKFACCQCKEAVYLSRAALGIHMRYDHSMLNHSCRKCPPPKKPSKTVPLKKKKSKPKPSIQNVTPCVSKQNNKGRRRINDGSMFSLYNVNINSPNIKLSEKAKKRKAPWAERFIKENIPSDLESFEDGNLENLRHNIRTVFNILSTVAPSRLKASVTSHLSSVTSRNVFGKNVNVLSIMFPPTTPSLPQRMSSNIESSNISVSAVKKPLNPLNTLDKPNVTENVIKNKQDSVKEKSNTGESFSTDNSLNPYPKSLNTMIDIVNHVESNITPKPPKEMKRKRMVDKIITEETIQSYHEHSCESTNNGKSASATKFSNQSVSVPLKKRKLYHEKIDQTRPELNEKIDQNAKSKKKEDKTVETTKSPKKETTPFQLYKIPKITVKNFSKDMAIKNVNSSCEEKNLIPADNASVIMNVEKENSNSSNNNSLQIDAKLENLQPKLVSSGSAEVSVEDHITDEINTLESTHIHQNSTSPILNVEESSHIQKKLTKKHKMSQVLKTLKKKVSLTPKIHLQHYRHKTIPEKNISQGKLATRNMLKSHKIEPQTDSAIAKLKSANIASKLKDNIKIHKKPSPETQTHELEKCSDLNIPTCNINEKSSKRPISSEESLSQIPCTNEDTTAKQIKVILSDAKKEHNQDDKKIKADFQAEKQKVSMIENNNSQMLLPEGNDTREKLDNNKQSSLNITHSLESQTFGILNKKEKNTSSTTNMGNTQKNPDNQQSSPNKTKSSELQTSGILNKKENNTSSITNMGNTKPLQTSPCKQQPTTSNNTNKEFVNDSSNTVEKELSILFDMEPLSEESNLTNNKDKLKPRDTPATINEVDVNTNISSTSDKRRHKSDFNKKIKYPSSAEEKTIRHTSYIHTTYSLPVDKSPKDSDKLMPPKSPSKEKTNAISPSSPKKNISNHILVNVNQNKSVILPIALLGSENNKEKIKPIPGDSPATADKNPNISSSTSDKRRHKSDASKRMDIKSRSSNEKSTMHSNSHSVEKLNDSDKVLPPKSPSKEKTKIITPSSPKKNVVPIGETSPLVSVDQSKSNILPIPLLESQNNKEKIKPLPSDTPVTVSKVVPNPIIASSTSDKRRHRSDASKRMDIKSRSSNEENSTRRSESRSVEKILNDSDKVMPLKSPSKEKSKTITGNTSPLVSADKCKSTLLPIPLLESQNNKEKIKPIPSDIPVTASKAVLNPIIASSTSDKRRHRSDASKRMDIKSRSSNEENSTRRSKSHSVEKILNDSDKVLPLKSPSKEKSKTITGNTSPLVSADKRKSTILPIPLLESQNNKEKIKPIPSDIPVTVSKAALNPIIASSTSDKRRHRSDASKRMDIKSRCSNEGKSTRRSNSHSAEKTQKYSDKLTPLKSTSKEKTNTISQHPHKKNLVPNEVLKKSTSQEKKSDTESSLNYVKARSPIKKESISTALKSSHSEILNIKSKKEVIVPTPEKTSVSTDKAALTPTIEKQILYKKTHNSDVNDRIDIKSPFSNEGISTKCSNSLPVEKSPKRKRKSDDTVRVMLSKSPSKEKINEKCPSSPKKNVQIVEPSPQISTNRENMPNTNNNLVDPKIELLKSPQSQEIHSNTEEEIENVSKSLEATVNELVKPSEKMYSPEKMSLTPSTLTSIKAVSPIKKVIVIPTANKVVLSNTEVKSPEKIKSGKGSPVKPITTKKIIITKNMIIKSSPCKTPAPNVPRPVIEGLKVVMSTSNSQSGSNIGHTTNTTCENPANMTNNIPSSLGVITTDTLSPITQIPLKIDTSEDDKKSTAQQKQNINYDYSKPSESVPPEKLSKSAINDKTEENKIPTSEDEDSGKQLKKLQILLHRVDEPILLDKNKEMETTENNAQDMRNEESNKVTTSSHINYEQGIPLEDDYHLCVDSRFCLPESHFEEVQYDEIGHNVLEVANYVDVETTGSPLHSKTNSPVPMIESPTKEYTCTFCCMKFGDEIFLLNHLTEVHTYDKSGLQAQSSKTLYKCRSCGSGFRQKDVLDKHVKEEHVITGAYNCEHCSATYLYKYHLKRHVRNAHPAVSNATCDICMKKFNTFAALHSHNCSTPAEQNVLKPPHDEIIKTLPANEQNTELTVEGLKKMDEQEFVNETNSPPKKQVRFSDVIKEPPSEDNPALTRRVSKKQRKYKCNKCKSSFQSGLFLFNHVRLNHKDTILKCGTCKLEFMNSINFKQHVCKTVTKFECKKCLLLFTNRNALVEHRKEKHNMGTLKCDFCSKYFKTNTNLVKHIAAKHIESSEYTNAVNLPRKKIKWHSSSQVTSDIYDDLKIINQASSQAAASEVLVKSHSNVTNSDEVYKRNICKKNIKPKKVLILRSELGNIHRYHKCLKCSRKFSHKALLLKHIKYEHKIEPNKLHRCTECSAVFKFQDKLFQHYKMKHGQIRTTEKLSSLSQNSAAVNKIRKQRCSKPTGNKDHNSSIKKEQTTGTDVGIAQDVTVGQMYKCAECKAYLPSKDSLQRHMQWEHMKVGKCGHCGEVLATAEEFLRHLMSGHANEKIKEVLPAQLALPESRLKWKTQLAYKHERQAE